MFFPFALTYLETVVGVIISPERLTVKVSKLPNGCGILLVKIPIFFFPFLPPSFPNETPENELWSWGLRAWRTDSCWIQTKTIRDPTPFGVPSGKIFHLLLPIPGERKGLGMAWLKLCVCDRQMEQGRMNRKQQKHNWDLVSGCVNSETK